MATTPAESPASIAPSSPVVVQGGWRTAPHQPNSTVEDIWRRLVYELRVSGQTPADMTVACIDLYMTHLFPITPLVHEQSIRTTWAQAFNYGESSILLAQSPDSPNLHASPNIHSLVAPRALALLTAMCATASSLLPADLLPERELVAGPYLKASRELLSLHHDQDIERPDANSIIIRYFHANSIHAMGNTRLSWFILGESIRLALDMHLYDETTLVGLDPVEAQLRRAVFWQLYAGDRSAAILNDRPLSLLDLNLNAPLSLRYMSAEDTHLLDPIQTWNTTQFAQCLNTGFNLSTRLFSSATDVLLNLRMLQEFSASSSGSAELAQWQTAKTVDSVLHFSSVLDSMPDWLERPSQAGLHAEDDVASYQQSRFWTQHINLKVTFYCLRLIILLRAEDMGFASLLGFSADPRLLAMQKTDIARDMLSCIQSAPFQALQINGEPMVEKVRQVGATLLQISQSLDPHVAPRAKADLQVLLNILTRLDSKASDALCRDVAI
ncbi:hypothetical protein ACHAQA_007896 [Verticillium albo-atrum]